MKYKIIVKGSICPDLSVNLSGLEIKNERISILSGEIKDQSELMGDINLNIFFSPKESKVIWGVGPIFNLPTATDPALGAQEFGIGPAIILVKISGKWVYGATMNNTWSLGNSDINRFYLQYFVNYNLPNSWYLSSSPIVTANWNADSGNQWVVPFRGTVGKIFRLGKLPINAQVGAFYNAVKPDGGADWQTRLQLQLLFPK